MHNNQNLGDDVTEDDLDAFLDSLMGVGESEEAEEPITANPKPSSEPEEVYDEPQAHTHRGAKSGFSTPNAPQSTQTPHRELRADSVTNVPEKSKVLLVLSYLNVYVAIVTLFYKNDDTTRYVTIQALLIHTLLGLLHGLSRILATVSEDFYSLANIMYKSKIIVPLIPIGIFLVMGKIISNKTLDKYINKINERIS